MKDYKNVETNKKVVNEDTANVAHKDTQEYSYYSKLLKTPFDSIEELKDAEAAYYSKLKAKEDKAAEKKADALKVEDAFKALNTTRRYYKEGLTRLTEKYSADLAKLKETFEADRKEIQDILAAAEEAYSKAIKDFTNKYPEGYHLTLKDGDFETTISSNSVTKGANKSALDYSLIADIFDHIFRW